jgi:formate/nitrite transporter FocA (FNT family)
MAGCLFVAGFLAWWSDTLSEDAQKAYAVTQAESRVNQQWSVNFLRGVGCNLFVSVSLPAIEAAALMSPESPSQS